MTRRAPALAPEDRRAALVEVTLPLVLEHGRAVTTAQIAEAAGVAQGTIFRVFATKEELVEEAIDSAFDMDAYIRAVEALQPRRTLDETVTELAQLMIQRFSQVFAVISIAGHKGSPPRQNAEDWVMLISTAHTRLLEPFAGELTLPPGEVMRFVRLLAFSGSNPHITEGHLLTAAEISAIVLDGSRRKGP